MPNIKTPAVYILTNKKYGTLYTGVTSELLIRTYKHKNKYHSGFSQKYDCKILVWYEVHEDMITAIARKKQLKGGSRQKKLDLINTMNSDWKDLYEVIV